MIYVDIDGVLRDLDKAVRGTAPTDYDKLVDGVEFCDWVDKNLPVLLSAPKMEICDTLISELEKRNVAFKILSCQPEHWRGNTIMWLINNGIFSITHGVIFVEKAESKLNYLGEGDILIDDYPKFNDYSKIVLVNRPYNASVKGCLAYISNQYEIEGIYNKLNIGGV